MANAPTAVAIATDVSAWLDLRSKILLAAVEGRATGDFSKLVTLPYSTAAVTDSHGVTTSPPTKALVAGGYPDVAATVAAALKQLTDKPAASRDHIIAMTLQLDTMDSFKKQLVARRQRKAARVSHQINYDVGVAARLADIKKDLLGPVASPRKPKTT